MPEYTFENLDTGETIDIIQGMNDDHEYSDDNGKKWERVFTKPNAGMDTNLDETKASFNKVIDSHEGRGLTVGQAWDISREAGEKREKVFGRDTVKEKNFKDYAKHRNGIKHVSDPNQ
tara:strand:- start:125 stop:478 length:354 start_codon:yes stop_codon:yes gene_type:complete